MNSTKLLLDLISTNYPLHAIDLVNLTPYIINRNVTKSTAGLQDSFWLVMKEPESGL